MAGNPASAGGRVDGQPAANPLVFGTISSIPYGQYSVQRPGETSYSATVIYPVDVSHKRMARTEVACEAQRVLEAQYQDAVRLAIDRLYMAYLDVITARETLRFATANRDGLIKVYRLAESQLNNQRMSQPDVDRVGIQLDSAEISVEQARVTRRESLHVLGLMLAIPLEQAEQIELRGTIHDTSVPPPPHDQLLVEARSIRPDLVAYRLGVRRAAADVQLAEAEKLSDVFVLYTPYQLQNNAPIGGQNSTSWSAAVFGSIPLFNRNQGNIRRAAAQRLANADRADRTGTTSQRRSPRCLCGIPGQPRHRQPAGRVDPAALAAHSRRQPATARTGRDQRDRLSGRSARIQRRRAAISRRTRPPPPQHAATEYRRGPAHLSVREARGHRLQAANPKRERGIFVGSSLARASG